MDNGSRRAPHTARLALRRSPLIGLALSAVLLAALATSACAATGGTGSGGGGGSGGPVQLVYWTTDATLQGAVDLWNQQHPSTHVQMVQQASSGFADRLQAAVNARNGPDLATVDVIDVPRLVRANTLTSYHLGLDVPTAYYPIGLGPYYFPWGIQVDLDLLALFYYKPAIPQIQSILTKVDPNPDPWKGSPGASPWITYAQLQADAITYQAQTGQPLVNVDLKGDPALFSALVWQHGGTWFKEEVTASTYAVSITGQASQDVATYWDGLLAHKAVSLLSARSALSAGKAPFLIAPLSFAATLKAGGQAGSWGAALLPTDGDGEPRCGNEPRHFHIMPRPGPHVEQAEEFLKWLTTDPASLQLQLGAGLFPATRVAYTSAVDVQQLGAYYGVDGMAAVAKASADGLPAGFEYGPTMSYTFTRQAQLFGGQGTFAAALGPLQQDVVADLQKQGYKVAAA